MSVEQPVPSLARAVHVLLGAALALCLVPVAARAYGGPGSVVSGIGALVAAVVAIGAAIVGFFWFPLKRLVRKLRGGGEPGGEDVEDDVAEAS